MARRIIKLQDGKCVASSYGVDAEAKHIVAAFERGAPRDGYYRAGVNAIRGSGGRISGKRGARIANPSKEAARLRERGEGRTVAKTGMPGVAGFAEAANASNYAGAARRRESLDLAQWIELMLARP